MRFERAETTESLKGERSSASVATARGAQRERERRKGQEIKKASAPEYE